MRRALALTAVAALALASGAGGSRSKVITAKLGDSIDVLGSRIVCQVQVSKKHFKGKKIVGCLEADARGPIVGTYAPAVAGDGEVQVLKVGKNRQATTIYRRLPAGVGGGARTLRVSVGDTIFVGGTDLVCGVTRQEGKVAISCYVQRGLGRPRPGTNGFLLNDALAAVLRYQPSGDPKVIWIRNHGA